MSADRLAEIEERLAASTEGPWAIWEDLTDGGFVHVGDVAGVIPEGEMATEDGVETNPTAKVYTTEDADLIAHAPTDLAALVAVVKTLRQDLREVIDEKPDYDRMQGYEIHQHDGQVELAQGLLEDIETALGKPTATRPTPPTTDSPNEGTNA